MCMIPDPALCRLLEQQLLERAITCTSIPRLRLLDHQHELAPSLPSSSFPEPIDRLINPFPCSGPALLTRLCPLLLSVLGVCLFQHQFHQPLCGFCPILSNRVAFCHIRSFHVLSLVINCAVRSSLGVVIQRTPHNTTLNLLQRTRVSARFCCYCYCNAAADAAVPADNDDVWVILKMVKKNLHEELYATNVVEQWKDFLEGRVFCYYFNPMHRSWKCKLWVLRYNSLGVIPSLWCWCL